MAVPCLRFPYPCLNLKAAPASQQLHDAVVQLFMDLVKCCAGENAGRPGATRLIPAIARPAGTSQAAARGLTLPDRSAGLLLARQTRKAKKTHQSRLRRYSIQGIADEGRNYSLLARRHARRRKGRRG